MMKLAKRVSLFLLLNFLVVLTVSALLQVFGVNSYHSVAGINYQSLLVFCLIWGMSGSLISLALSRIMAKTWMGVQVIDPETRNPELRQLVQTVYELARRAGIQVMPEVGIYESAEVNAFATGPTANRSLVAVSTGLLERMNAEELKGVLGHEVAHVANGDMVTMTLLQGVINAFAMFLARILTIFLVEALRSRSDRDDEGHASSHSGLSGMMGFFIRNILEMIFMLLGSMVVAAFSRYREFRADAGGAQLAGRSNMIAALQALRRTFDFVDSMGQPAVQSLKISGRPGGLMALFASHPSLEDRIERLKTQAPARQVSGSFFDQR
jgi:heat shock protein HtpX